MKRYKLTAQNLRTHNDCQWVIGEEKQTSGIGELCGEGWLHCYAHPLLAILLNPIHASIKNLRLFEVNCGGSHKTDRGLKEGFTKMIIIKELEIPTITLNQKIAFGILCSLEVFKEPSYMLWANNWLNNIDRSRKAANAAANAAAANAANAAAANAANAAAADYAAAAAAAAVAAAYADNIDLIKIAKKSLTFK